MTGPVIVLLIISAIIFWPLLVIWSLNLLFGLTIPFTLGTWFAVFILITTMANIGRSSKET